MVQSNTNQTSGKIVNMVWYGQVVVISLVSVSSIYSHFTVSFHFFLLNTLG